MEIINSGQFFSHRSVDLDSESGGSEDSFTLKFTESSESDDFELQVSVSDQASDIGVNQVFENYYLSERLPSTTICSTIEIWNKDRPVSPVFEFKKPKKITVSTRSLQREEDTLSSESEFEPTKITKITKNVISSDEEGSVLGFVSKYNLRPRRSKPKVEKSKPKVEKKKPKVETQQKASAFVGRVTRSQTLKKFRILQKQELKRLKNQRRQAAKSSISFVGNTPSVPTSVTESLRRKLRDMKLFCVI